jgi:hypothetical protein
MTSLSLGTTLSPITNNNSSPGQLSPRLSVDEKQATQGIASGDSSISSANNTTTPLAPLTNNNSKVKEELKLNNSDLSSSIPNSTKSKGSSEPEPEPIRTYSYSDVTIPQMISTIFQRFLVRMPHTFIAMTMVYVPLYYGLGNENLAISATTFVGVGGTVYCFVRAFFLETIPEWMLARNNDTKIWRRLMNVTYTCFITAMFTSAVWKLPDLSTVQGFAFFTASFVAPYPMLAKFYPDIDRQPNSFERKYGLKL